MGGGLKAMQSRFPGRTVYWLVLVFCGLSSFFSLQALDNYFTEQSRLGELNSKFVFSQQSLDTDIRSFRDMVYRNHVKVVKSEDELAQWYASRPLLRQSSLQSLDGRPVFCGEFSRLMINLLQNRGMRARRVYLYESRAANHVVWEYWHPELRKWVFVGSAPVAKFSDVRVTEPLTVDEMLRFRPGFYSRYYHFRPGFGLQIKNVPYPISYMLDNPYFLEFCIALLMALLSGAGAYLLRWRCSVEELIADEVVKAPGNAGNAQA